MNTRRTYAIALALLAVLLWYADREVPIVNVQDVGLHVGKQVVINGTVSEARMFDSGGRFHLSSAGYGVVVRAETVPVNGAHVSVQGALLRRAGQIELQAAAWHEIAATPVNTTLTELARNPRDWEGAVVALAGVATNGTLQDSRITLHIAGDSGGPLVGKFEYNRNCLCYQLKIT